MIFITVTETRTIELVITITLSNILLSLPVRILNCKLSMGLAVLIKHVHTASIYTIIRSFVPVVYYPL